MQKLGTGLLINRMVIDGHRVFVERIDGQWQVGTEREGLTMTVADLDLVGDERSKRFIEQAMAESRPVAIAVAPDAPPMTEDDELVVLANQLTPDVRGELFALLRAKVSATPMSAPRAAVAPGEGYVYTDPDTGAKRWVPGDMAPEEVSAAIPCQFCGKMWDSQPAMKTHARQCADNPGSRNYKGALPELPPEETPSEAYDGPAAFQTAEEGDA